MITCKRCGAELHFDDVYDVLPIGCMHVKCPENPVVATDPNAIQCRRCRQPFKFGEVFDVLPTGCFHTPACPAAPEPPA